MLGPVMDPINDGQFSTKTNVGSILDFNVPRREFLKCHKVQVM